jgi:periplasmic divalent cation tolerance protein
MEPTVQTTEFVEVRWTSGSIDEARKISRMLVTERLVIHAQIIPWVESIYLLDNKLETTQQSQIILLTEREHCEKICALIKKNSSYEVPEITWMVVGGGNPEYLSWS